MITIKGDLILEKDTEYNESLTVEGNISGKDGVRYDLKVKGDINAKNINAWDINALDIDALDINAWDINAKNIDYYAVCFAYNNITCKSIKGTRKNCKHFCLGGQITIKEEKPKCKECGRELSPEYVEIANKRIQQLTSQTKKDNSDSSNENYLETQNNFGEENKSEQMPNAVDNQSDKEQEKSSRGEVESTNEESTNEVSELSSHSPVSNLDKAKKLLQRWKSLTEDGCWKSEEDLFKQEVKELLKEIEMGCGTKFDKGINLGFICGQMWHNKLRLCPSCIQAKKICEDILGEQR